MRPAIRTIQGDEVDPLAVTNENGEFCLTSDAPNLSVRVTVRAHGLAAFPCCTLHAGAQTRDIGLGPGVTVQGRLVVDGRPVGDAAIQKNRILGVGFLGEYTTTTNGDGSFHFFNLPPNLDYYVYAKMDSLQERGALVDREFQMGDHGSQQDLGELSLEPAHRMTGRVMLNDGGRIPDGTHLLFSRHNAWDSQIIEVDADGRFAVQGLPQETVTIHLRVPGYRLAKSNPSLDPISAGNPVGLVAEDMDDFLIELEPGDPIRI